MKVICIGFKNNKDNYIDLSNCQRKVNNVIDWNNSIGAIVPFLFNGIKSYFTIKEYQKKGSMVKVEYNDNIYTLHSTTIRHCGLNKLFPKDYLYNVGDIINNKKILEKVILNKDDPRHKCRGYKVECQICGNIYIIYEHEILKTTGCKKCHGKEIKLICDYRPDLRIYFQEKDLNYFYEKTLGSALELNFVCPICGNTKKISINTLVSAGLGCSHCSDKISSGEKFMKNILDQLNIDYIYQFKFDNHTYFNNKKYKPVYDFCIPNLNLIIEIDGEQHYKEVKIFGIQTEKDLLKDELANKNGYKVVRILYKSLNYKELYDNIYNQLSNYLTFININFTYAVNFAKKSLVQICSDLWNDGKGSTEICRITQLDKSTVRRYLEISAQIGLSNYNTTESRKRASISSRNNNIARRQKIICIDTGDIFVSKRECSEKSFEVFGKHIGLSSISNNILGYSKSAGGFHFAKYREDKNV